MGLFPDTSERLTALFARSPVIEFDDNDRFIFFSDCHRGDSSWKDDYAPNRHLHLHALNHYFKSGYSYIELGDGDELFEVADFADIRYAHSNVFKVMRKIYENGRFYLLHGNHDIERNNPAVVEAQLSHYYSYYDDQEEPLFPNIQVHEGLILHHRATGQQIFLFHGHQGDLFNDHLWPLARLLVRQIWTRLQFMGWRDPTLPPKPYKKAHKVEERITAWVQANQQMVICGHTHRSWLAKPGEVPYFNPGSCVHPRCITGLEIENGAITLVKWELEPQEDLATGAGLLHIRRTVLAAGPVPLAAYMQK